MLGQLKMLSVGLLFILLGIILLSWTSTSIGSDVFFIFPFFFFGGSNILSFVILVTLVFVIFGVAIHLTSTYIPHDDSQFQGGTQSGFIPIGSRCRYCSKPIPIDSSFCPFCGSAIDQNGASNDGI